MEISNKSFVKCLLLKINQLKILNFYVQDTVLNTKEFTIKYTHFPGHPT